MVLSYFLFLSFVSDNKQFHILDLKIKNNTYYTYIIYEIKKIVTFTIDCVFFIVGAFFCKVALIFPIFYIQ